MLFLKTVANLDLTRSEDIQKPDDTTNRHTQNRLLKVREAVTACAAHPLNGTIVAGTKVCIFARYH